MAWALLSAFSGWAMYAPNEQSMQMMYCNQGGGQAAMSMSLGAVPTLNNRAAVTSAAQRLAITNFDLQGSAADWQQEVNLTWQVQGADLVQIFRVSHTETCLLYLQTPEFRFATDRGTAQTHALFYRLVAWRGNERVFVDRLTSEQLAQPQGQTFATKATLPFADQRLDVNEHTLFYHQNSVFFATHDEKLFKYSRQSQGSWQQEWSLTLDGAVSNPPVVHNGYLYYTLSMVGERGRLCRVPLSYVTHQECSQVRPTNLIASPVIVPRTEPDAHSVYSAQASTQPLWGVYGFGRDGSVEVFRFERQVTISARTMMPNAVFRNVLSTPQLITAQISRPDNPSGRALFVLRQQNTMLGIQVPISQSHTHTLYDAMQAAYGRSTAPSDESDTLQLLWKKEL
ncbi:hypothetical protein CWB98_15750 [Pseudoalteromonas rubra]|uniref:Uncharacterized protein n=2 Tax=Pseudoalteromonas rubra TaxID=43658 RepID=A0A5S3WYY2_9GAMM|nr:hypothetical protein CWB98_15750 [Pseudoalteromonas rubra]